MEREVSANGNLLMELCEAEQLECSLEETTPLSLTRMEGGFLTIICC